MYKKSCGIIKQSPMVDTYVHTVNTYKVFTYKQYVLQKLIFPNHRALIIDILKLYSHKGRMGGEAFATCLVILTSLELFSYLYKLFQYQICGSSLQLADIKFFCL